MLLPLLKECVTLKRFEVKQFMHDFLHSELNLYKLLVGGWSKEMGRESGEEDGE